MTCIAQSKPLSVLSPPKEGDRIDFQEPLGRYLNELLMKLVPLRTEARRLLGPDLNHVTQEAVEGLLHRAQGLGVEFDLFRNSVPEDWHSRSIPCFGIETDDAINQWIWPGLVYRCNNPNTIYVSNACRSAQIFVYGIIYQCLTWLTTTTALCEYRYQSPLCLHKMQELVDEMCATVPQVVGIDVDALEASHLTGTLGTEAPKIANVGAIGPTMLLTSLWIANSVVTIPKAQRLWIGARMYTISEEFGFPIGQRWQKHSVDVFGWQQPSWGY